jgi:hypothetical protein
MPLSSDPSVTFNAQGNILAISTSIAASASSTGNIVDFSSSCLGGWIQITATGLSSVSATNGCQVSIFPAGDSTPHYDTIAMWTFTIPITASTVTPESIQVPTGKYSIMLKNLDATNGIDAGITSNPIA